MYNYVMLIGRIAKDIELNETESKKTFVQLTLAVNRPFKNAQGIFDTDFIKVTVWNQVANITSDYCKKGMMVAVKGRVVPKYEEVNGVTHYSSDIVCDNIVFVSPKED